MIAGGINFYFIDNPGWSSFYYLNSTTHSHKTYFGAIKS